MRHTKCLIIGSGPAGYTASIYASRFLLDPIVISGNDPGGQLMITTEVENFPGFAKPIYGPNLMERMMEQAKNVGAKIVDDHVESVDLLQSPFICKTQNGDTYSCDTLIIATGARAKWLGLPSEKKFMGFGVSGCAVCDGMFFKCKDVCVVGGGDTAAEEALYLASVTKKVYVIHRRAELRAQEESQKRMFSNPCIEMIWNHEIVDILGEESPHKKVTHIRIKDTQTSEEKTMPIDGVFVAIGHKPQTDLFKGQIDLNSEGYINVKPGTSLTSVKGVFACGDVHDASYRQAITAAGFGCIAAIDAHHYIQENFS